MALNRIGFEHIGINVAEPVKMARWYCGNLGMKVMRKGEPPVSAHFLADADEKMMMEIYHNPPDAVPDYASMNPLLLHIAFSVDGVEAVKDDLVAAGAVKYFYELTADGDEIAILRDPWGLPIQFIKRAKSMLKIS